VRIDLMMQMHHPGGLTRVIRLRHQVGGCVSI
jgi:hypothetical protein